MVKDKSHVFRRQQWFKERGFITPPNHAEKKEDKQREPIIPGGSAAVGNHTTAVFMGILETKPAWNRSEMGWEEVKKWGQASVGEFFSSTNGFRSCAHTWAACEVGEGAS